MVPNSSKSRLFTLLWLCFASSHLCLSQDGVIKIDTRLVSVPLTVFDRSGRHITNLKKEDFRVFENGVEQEIKFLDTVDKLVTVLLVMDVSGSMLDDADALANAATIFLNNLRPYDTVAAATFNQEVHFIFNFAEAKEVWKRKKFKLRVDGLPPVTMIYDGMDFALRKMEKVKGRKAIIFFSDAVGSGIFASAESNFQDAEENEAVIYTVQFGAFEQPLKPANRKRLLETIATATDYMVRMAEISGGKHYQIEKIDDLERTFVEIVRELGLQYNLGYHPKTEAKRGERRRIKVETNVPNLVVRARDSYLVTN